jgi:CMP-N,N'-diacetyllegionaminic acid synthase
MSKNILALIPARAGSKGVPGKNKASILGKPLIQYTIESALSAPSISKIVVSSDDEEILALAMEMGISTIKRPAELAKDDSNVVDVVKHTIEKYKGKENNNFDAIVLLQPTSPLRSGKDIENAIELFLLNRNETVCSVYKADDNHPARMYSIKDGKLKSLMPDLSHIRRQDLPPVYHRNGCIYVFSELIALSGYIIHDSMVPYVMNKSSSVNIDGPEDLLLLETILKNGR